VCGKRRKEKKQEQTRLKKKQETGSRKTIFNRDLIGKVLVLFSKLG
jgi:hypothetical protein